MEWGWARDDCIQQIEAAGLPQPGKSSCFFCPSMRAEEIIHLRDHHPDLFRSGTSGNNPDMPLWLTRLCC